MIITTAYFKNDIYLPHAKPGVSDKATDVESKVVDFINEYEQDCLIKSLGSRLATEFFAELDDSELTLIESGADAKWDALLNGLGYTRPNGDNVVWEGIRRVTTSLGASAESTVYDKSFLAQYVYFFYESNSHITRGNAGSGRNKSANSETVIPNNKVVKAWRLFLRQVQGEAQESPYFVKSGLFGGVGVDHFVGGDGSEINMYQFINDQNELVADTYENFEPKVWGRINQLMM